MSINVIMPVLGMTQETGKIVRWLKSHGEQVKKGEPLIEVETDKAIAEIEAPGDGILANITANEGDVVPVATVIAVILAPDEAGNDRRPEVVQRTATQIKVSVPEQSVKDLPALAPGILDVVTVSPLARRIAEENNLDLRLIKPKGNKIEKADVYAYLERQKSAAHETGAGRLLASPKARRLIKEKRIPPPLPMGSGPGGAILAADLEEILAHPGIETQSPPISPVALPVESQSPIDKPASFSTVGTSWRIMSERTTLSWQTAPHFYLMREINASQMIQWRDNIRTRAATKVTITDLLVKVVAEALHRHPRMNASWQDGHIALFGRIHVGLAVAVEDGLVVPVIRNADQKSINELAAERERLIASAKAKSLHLEDIRDGTFTLSNLGMYMVDAFYAIINPPQAAILAVGRIADRVVPVDGQIVIQPTMILSLSCDHRVIDGATGAMFLQTVAEMIEQPLRILE
ncbi:MAG TPA: 2-oxo acid dehydrogenase subunit E2 [Anaerolineales bacterium]|nr:2-oxo acid dehydrogenase subunit E2 [Anaerolineales bacterium]